MRVEAPNRQGLLGILDHVVGEGAAADLTGQRVLATEVSVGSSLCLFDLRRVVPVEEGQGLCPAREDQRTGEGAAGQEQEVVPDVEPVTKQWAEEESRSDEADGQRTPGEVLAAPGELGLLPRPVQGGHDGGHKGGEDEGSGEPEGGWEGEGGHGDSVGC